MQPSICRSKYEQTESIHIEKYGMQH